MKQTQSKWSIKKTKVFHDDKRVGTNFDIYEGHELNVVARVRRGDRNLVASAPELLKALNGILGYFSEYEEDYSEKLECFENARKVIAKAERKS